MCACVEGEVLLLRTRVVAQRTGVGTIARVDAHMSLQVGFCREMFTTLFADVRVFTAMNSHMDGEM